jgi:hypothetical protein
MGAAAIAEFLDQPDAYSVEEIKAAIKRLTRDGDCTRMVTL